MPASIDPRNGQSFQSRFEQINMHEQMVECKDQLEYEFVPESQ